MVRKWRIRSSRTLLQRPPWLQVEEQEVELGNGHVISGYLLTHVPEVSMVFDVTEQQDILFVEQYKHGAGTAMWSLPAGYVEDDEDPFDCARRELEEETAHRGQEWHSLGSWYVNPNRSRARYHFFLALDAESSGRQALDPTEEITVHRVPLIEVEAVLESGKVSSLASWAGILAGLARLRKLRPALSTA